MQSLGRREHQQIFERIIDILRNLPTISCHDFSCSFLLHVDTSSKDWVVRFQKINGEITILNYGNRSLNKTEQKYHSSKLEFLVFKRAVTEHFSNHLLYTPLIAVYTDNNSCMCFQVQS